MDKTLLNKWTFSSDEEYWNNDDFPTREEAIEAGKEAYAYIYENAEGFGEGFDDFYVGQMVDIKFECQDAEWLDLAEQVMEEFEDALSDEIGEASEYWSDRITKEDEDDLNKRLAKAIMEWMEERHTQNTAYGLENVELITDK